MNKPRCERFLLILIAALGVGAAGAYFSFGGMKGLFCAAMGAVMVFNLTFSLFLLRKYGKK